MRKSTWLIIAIAAAFGLRMPVCMVACFESGPGATMVTSAQPATANPPCHQTTEAPDVPQPDRDHECECDGIRAVIAKAESKAPASDIEIPDLRISRAYGALPSPPDDRGRIWHPPDPLPPPAILLLNSTLLL